MAGPTSHLVSKKKLPSQKMIQSLATSPLPDILLQDPQEDPVPTISEDLTSVRLFPETTSLLQEIWVTKQRTNRQLLVKKAYRWMVIEEQEQLATRTRRISKPTQKRAPEPSAGTHIQQENTQLDSLDSYLWCCLEAGPIHTSYRTEWKPFSLSSYLSIAKLCL